MPQLPIVNDETHDEFLENEYQNVKALIYAYDQAISALLTGTHQSYQLDTGQSSQRVTRLNLAELQSTRASLLNELNSLASRLGKIRSVVTVIPGF